MHWALLAASIYYKRQIILYSDNSKKRIIMSDRYSDSHAFRLGFVDGNHYVSLLPDLPASSLPIANLQLPEPEIPNKSLDVENDVENSNQCFPTTTKSKNSGKSEPGLGACDKKIFMKRKLQFSWLMAAGDGALCVACAAYYSNRSLPKGTKGVFINTPFINWAKSTGCDPKNNKLLKHDVSGIHKAASACHDAGKQMSTHHTTVYGMLHKQSAEQQRVNLEKNVRFC
jgi:hypothetical protein